MNAWITYTIKVGVGSRHSILRTVDDLLTPPNSQTPQMNSCLMIRGSGAGVPQGPGKVHGKVIHKIVELVIDFFLDS